MDLCFVYPPAGLGQHPRQVLQVDVARVAIDGERGTEDDDRGAHARAPDRIIDAQTTYGLDRHRRRGHDGRQIGERGQTGVLTAMVKADVVADDADTQTLEPHCLEDGIRRGEIVTVYARTSESA